MSSQGSTDTGMLAIYFTVVTTAGPAAALHSLYNQTALGEVSRLRNYIELIHMYVLLLISDVIIISKCMCMFSMSMYNKMLPLFPHYHRGSLSTYVVMSPFLHEMVKVLLNYSDQGCTIVGMDIKALKNSLQNCAKGSWVPVRYMRVMIKGHMPLPTRPHKWLVH